MPKLNEGHQQVGLIQAYIIYRHATAITMSLLIHLQIE